MFLKNYTSSVPVSETIARIEKTLIRCGATGILKDYGIGGKVTAVTFRIKTSTGDTLIRLPADVDAALDALWQDYIGEDLLPNGTLKWSSRKQKKKLDFSQQAERTAWKIMQDWIEVQMSMIQLKQAEPLQVFLPYIYDGRQTYYQALRASNFAGLLENVSSS